MGRIKIYLFSLMVILILGGVTSCGQPLKKVDWTMTYYNDRTDPYGTYITYELLKESFPNKKTEATRKTISKNVDELTYNSNYEYIDVSDVKSSNNNDEEESEYIEEEDEKTVAKQISNPTTYMFIYESFKLGSGECEELLDFVFEGNNVFVSAEFFDADFLESLDVKSMNNADSDDRSGNKLVDFPNKEYILEDSYAYTKFPRYKHEGKDSFSKYFDINSSSSAVYVIATNLQGQPTFIRLQLGDGYLFLHTSPILFTNVAMLDTDQYDYVSRCLSYIPRDNNILWDEYQKKGELQGGSMFRVIFSNKALTIAFWLILLGFLLFMIFRAKRIQRIIPVITPPANSSIEFLDTIGNLYYQKKDFKSIVEKRHAYFLDYIRKNYYMSTEIIDSDFIEALSAKADMPKRALEKLFTGYAREIEGVEQIGEEAFLAYCNLLEEFYKKAKESAK